MIAAKHPAFTLLSKFGKECRPDSARRALVFKKGSHQGGQMDSVYAW